MQYYSWLIADRPRQHRSLVHGTRQIEDLDRTGPGYQQMRMLYETIHSGIIESLKEHRSFSPPSAHTIDAAISSRGSVGDAVASYVRAAIQAWITGARSNSTQRFYFMKRFEEALESSRKSGQGYVFRITSEKMIELLIDIANVTEVGKIGYLSPIADVARQQGCLVAATLNYDNSVEQMARVHGVDCWTGISDGSASSKIDLPDNGLLLLKLHGSIDWETEEATPTGPYMPQNVVKKVDLAEVRDEVTEGPFRPAVIFGQRNKLTAEGPFLELLRAFENGLSGADILCTVGYSFRDKHINEYITKWLNGDGKRRLWVVDKEFPNAESPYAKQLIECCNTRINATIGPASEGLKTIQRLWEEENVGNPGAE